MINDLLGILPIYMGSVIPFCLVYLALKERSNQYSIKDKRVQGLIFLSAIGIMCFLRIWHQVKLYPFIVYMLAFTIFYFESFRDMRFFSRFACSYLLITSVAALYEIGITLRNFLSANWNFVLGEISFSFRTGIPSYSFLTIFVAIPMHFFWLYPFRVRKLKLNLLHCFMFCFSFLVSLLIVKYPSTLLTRLLWITTFGLMFNRRIQHD